MSPETKAYLYFAIFLIFFAFVVHDCYSAMAFKEAPVLTKDTTDICVRACGAKGVLEVDARNCRCRY